MRFVILDVEHGFAAYAIAQDGSALLFAMTVAIHQRFGPLMCFPNKELERYGTSSYRITMKIT